MSNISNRVPYLLTVPIPYLPTVLIFDFQNLQKSGRPNFQNFQLVNIPVFNVIFEDINQYFPGFFFSANREEIKISFIDLNHIYDWFVDFGAECNAYN